MGRCVGGVCRVVCRCGSVGEAGSSRKLTQGSHHMYVHCSSIHRHQVTLGLLHAHMHREFTSAHTICIQVLFVRIIGA